jgi:hypothetical protein
VCPASGNIDIDRYSSDHEQPLSVSCSPLVYKTLPQMPIFSQQPSEDISNYPIIMCVSCKDLRRIWNSFSSSILLVCWVKQEPGRVRYVLSPCDTYHIIELGFHDQFVNAATGSDLAVGQNLRGCTTDIQVVTGTAPENKSDCKVVFVDTPAFDIELDDNAEIKIKKQFEKWRKKT